MGFLDSILGKPSAAAVEEVQGKKIPFALTYAFKPVRLAAKSDNSVELSVELSNVSGEEQLCSLLVEVPKGIGFDGVGIHKTKEMRVGRMNVGEKKIIPIGLHGSSQTPPGAYRIQLTAFSHYRDYSHVLNSVSKAAELRVV